MISRILCWWHGHDTFTDGIADCGRCGAMMPRDLDNLYPWLYGKRARMAHTWGRWMSKLRRCPDCGKRGNVCKADEKHPLLPW